MDSSNAPDATPETPPTGRAAGGTGRTQPPGDRPILDRTGGMYPDSSSSRHGRHRHGGSREGKLQRRLWITRGVAIVAVVAAVALTLVAIGERAQLATVAAENDTLRHELKRAEGEAQQAKKLVAAQEVELGALMRQRLPGVALLELDKLYDVSNRYFKKLSFSESGVGNVKRLTYYAVLKNTETAPATPAATILLFDRKGLQTGMARILRESATPASDREELAPGETRTYSAQIESIRPDKPAYFLVEVK